mgnify:CR=1 FL=1|tara:strand:- start:811 stop:1065 length:255 start_codon:yes stop_codon:yes gene_type:complete
MCFNNQQPRPPEVKPPTPPPPPKPLQIAQTSRLPAREVQQKEKKQVRFGARSMKEDAAKGRKRDAASLLVPMNDTGSKPGGLNP